jgi:hypothetical protein
LLLVGLVWRILLWLIRPSNRSGDGTTFWLVGSLLPSLAITALTVIAGTTVIIGHGGGLYWLAPAERQISETFPAFVALCGKTLHDGGHAARRTASDRLGRHANWDCGV